MLVDGDHALKSYDTDRPTYTITEHTRFDPTGDKSLQKKDGTCTASTIRIEKPRGS